MGPIMGGFITMSHLGWRWTQWITLIMAALFGTIGVIVIPETFAPVLLKQKAKRLRYQQKNWALHAKFEEQEINLKQIVDKYLLRSFRMLSLEPILVLVTLYMSLIYGMFVGTRAMGTIFPDTNFLCSQVSSTASSRSSPSPSKSNEDGISAWAPCLSSAFSSVSSVVA